MKLKLIEYISPRYRYSPGGIHYSDISFFYWGGGGSGVDTLPNPMGWSHVLHIFLWSIRKLDNPVYKHNFKHNISTGPPRSDVEILRKMHFVKLIKYDNMNVTNQNQSLVRNESGHYWLKMIYNLDFLWGLEGVLPPPSLKVQTKTKIYWWTQGILVHLFTRLDS